MSIDERKQSFLAAVNKASQQFGITMKPIVVVEVFPPDEEASMSQTKPGIALKEIANWSEPTGDDQPSRSFQLVE